MERARKLLKEKQDKEVEECTFKPVLKAKKSIGSKNLGPVLSSNQSMPVLGTVNNGGNFAKNGQPARYLD